MLTQSLTFVVIPTFQVIISFSHQYKLLFELLFCIFLHNDQLLLSWFLPPPSICNLHLCCANDAVVTLVIVRLFINYKKVY